MSAPDSGGDDLQPPAAVRVSRDDIPELLDKCGFKLRCWPSYPNVCVLVLELGGTEPTREAQQMADDVLSEAEDGHSAFVKQFEAQGGAAAFTEEQRQAPDGPYRPLARLLAEFLVNWARADVFGHELTELTGLVVAEHHLAMEGFVARLGYPTIDGGAVVAWLRRARDGEDVLINLENAILGRFRRPK